MAVDILRIEKLDGIIRENSNMSRANNCLVLKRVRNLFLWQLEQTSPLSVILSNPTGSSSLKWR